MDFEVLYSIFTEINIFKTYYGKRYYKIYIALGILIFAALLLLFYPIICPGLINTTIVGVCFLFIILSSIYINNIKNIYPRL